MATGKRTGGGYDGLFCAGLLSVYAQGDQELDRKVLNNEKSRPRILETAFYLSRMCSCRSGSYPSLSPSVKEPVIQSGPVARSTKGCQYIRIALNIVMDIKQRRGYPSFVYTGVQP